MTDVARELNWAGTYSYAAKRIERPDTIAGVTDAVAAADSVRALGTRHSFNDVADGPDLLLDVTGIPADLEIAADRRTATVGAGTRYAELAVALEAEGLALHNMGSLPHISVAGAVATGTHGSGSALGTLSSAVAALEIAGPSGTLRTVRRGDADFAGSVIALGALGVVTRVSVDVQPSYRMRQDAYGDLRWSTFLANLPEVFAFGYSVCCFTRWDDAVEVLVKSRVPEDADDVAMPDELLGARRTPAAEPSDRRTPVNGTVGTWADRLPHFLIGGTPSVGAEIQSEHFVPLRHAAAALEAVHALGERIRPHLHVAELRTVAADDLWLSPTQGEDCLCIAFTWQKHPEDVAGLLPDLEAALAPFGQRPHWGKMSSLDGDAIAALYPRLPDFRALVARTDPQGVFGGPFLERILGIR